MTIHTFSSREFTRDVGAAKRAALDGPVFITDRGQPAFALLTMDEYHRLSGHRSVSLLELMNDLPATDGCEFEAPQAALPIRPTDLS
ncbi:MAG TPA: hypothetical protein VLJ86_25305 [Ramlibacter sp.]|nr:hypothetical protein [Ramlibacter sp.]